MNGSPSYHFAGICRSPQTLNKRCGFAVLAFFLHAYFVLLPAAPAAASASSVSPLAARFARPPNEARIIQIIHSWPDQPSAQDALIERLLRQGFGGVVCNVSFQDYLVSAEKWSSFQRAVTAAKKAGLTLWLYDEEGYPSGTAGGLVTKGHPEWEATGLLIAQAETEGGSVALEVPPGRPFLMAAFPVINGILQLGQKRDLSEVARDGQLRWNAPPGRWQVFAVTEGPLFEGAHASLNLSKKIPYINQLLPEPTARFLEVTHQRYADRLGADLSPFFAATFTDEPSLMSLYLTAMPYRPLPWAANLPGEFQQRRGYALEPIIPALIADAGTNGSRWRYDFWLTVGELVSENYFGQIQTWCHRHHLASGGHLLFEDEAAFHTPLYGDFFRCIRRMDAPSIDCLTSLPPEVPWYIARLHRSVAELEHRSVVMCETSDHVQHYRPPGDQRPPRVVTEAEIRGTGNKLMVSGVNCITSYYSFAGLTDEALRRLNEWIGRCCAALTGGHQVADIALLYPAESMWVRFHPSRHYVQDAPEVQQVESVYRAAANSLFRANREFTFVDSRALAEAKAEAGTLVHGQLRWRIVILPSVDTLPLAAWENLAKFARGGGVVIALGALPANSEHEFPSSRVRTLSKEVFGTATSSAFSHPDANHGGGIYLPTGSATLLSVVLNEILEPEVKIGGKGSPIRSTHRRINGREIYFFVNDSDQPWKGEITLAVTGKGEQMNPADGQVTPLPPGNPIALELEPYRGTLLSFPGSRLPQRRPLQAGSLPGIALRPLPAVQPLVAHGEFVRERLETLEAPEAKQSLWTSTAALTKGQVDTHLFVRFPYTSPVDLSGAEWLVLDTRVPAGQRTATQILVILQEQGGGDFIASTGRSLSAAGHDRVFVPLNQFQLAGWSKDADGQLDLTRVREIRVGWGGYWGREGEQVQFTLSPIQIGAGRP